MGADARTESASRDAGASASMEGPQHPRVACVGLGHWGKNLARNFSELGHLAWICDEDEQVLASRAEEYPEPRSTRSFDAVLEDEDVDAVCIATPAQTHAELARRALEAGKDVFVEKPLALSMDEGERLVDLAEREGRVLMVGHLLWYHPAVEKLKELVDAGELGRIRYLTSNRLNLGKIRRAENILWSFAPHDISVILGLVGEMPDSVRAHGGSYLHERIADITSTFFSFPSGVRAHIFVSWLHPFKEQKLVVVGDAKMAVFNDMAETDKLVVYPHTIDWRNNTPVATKAKGTPVPFEPMEPLRRECEHFLQCVRDRSTSRTDGREALRVLSVLTECQRRLDAPEPEAESAHRGIGTPDPVASAPTGASRDGRSGAATGIASPGGAASRDARPYFVHESAYVEPDAMVGEGTKIWYFSHVRSGARVGRGCSIGQNVEIGPGVHIGDNVKIQNNVSVYEGVILEDHVFCGPSMVFTNVHNPRSEVSRMDEVRETHVKEGATFGANCTVLCGHTIGRYAFVGAGAVVTRDVPDYGLVVGNPARLVGWMCECGERVAFEDAAEKGACRACGRRYVGETSDSIRLVHAPDSTADDAP